MKDLSVLKYLLGVEVARSPKSMFSCQHKYTLDILKEIGLLGSHPAPTPIEQNHGLFAQKTLISKLKPFFYAYLCLSPYQIASVSQIPPKHIP